MTCLPVIMSSRDRDRALSSVPMGSGGNVLNARGFTGQSSVKQLFNGIDDVGPAIALPMPLR